MIAAIVPQFFSSDLERTLAYFDERLGFDTQFEYGDPVVYAGAIRDGLSIFFRHVDDLPPPAPNKYGDELLDAYLRVDGIEQLYREYSESGVQFHRELSDMPWGYTEFVVKDPDGRLLCFGQETERVTR